MDVVAAIEFKCMLMKHRKKLVNISYYPSLLGFSPTAGTFIWEKDTACLADFEEITRGVGELYKLTCMLLLLINCVIVI